MKVREFKAIEVAKGGYYCQEFLVAIKVLALEVCEAVLLFVSPKAVIGPLVVDRVRSRVVPTAILRSERKEIKRSVTDANLGNEIEGLGRSGLQEWVDREACYVASNGLNGIYLCVVEAVKHNNL